MRTLTKRKSGSLGLLLVATVVATVLLPFSPAKANSYCTSAPSGYVKVKESYLPSDGHYRVLIFVKGSTRFVAFKNTYPAGTPAPAITQYVDPEIADIKGIPGGTTWCSNPYNGQITGVIVGLGIGNLASVTY